MNLIIGDKSGQPYLSVAFYVLVKKIQNQNDDDRIYV